MLTFIVFVFAGAISGAVIAYALDMKTPKEIAQGALGGLISGLLTGFMFPH
jgi:uncharacterized membrane protein